MLCFSHLYTIQEQTFIQRIGIEQIVMLFQGIFWMHIRKCILPHLIVISSIVVEYHLLNCFANFNCFVSQVNFAKSVGPWCYLAI
jgi:hypothetical protein